MNNLFSFLKDYKHLEKAIVNVIISEFFIQMVNATFMNILPLYMTRKGYSDEEIALFITFRFLGVFDIDSPPRLDYCASELPHCPPLLLSNRHL